PPLRWLRTRWCTVCLLVCLACAVCLQLRTELGRRKLVAHLVEEHLPAAHSVRPIVYVVEEHQEALLKWLADALHRRGPRGSRLMLLHIDAHSDMSLPQLDGFPYARLPASWPELGAMVDRNDEFIMSAAYSGLIDRLIFLRPDWTADPELPANQLRRVASEVRSHMLAGRLPELLSLSFLRDSWLSGVRPCVCLSAVSSDADNSSFELDSCRLRMDVELLRNQSEFASCSEDKAALRLRALSAQLSWTESGRGSNLLAQSGLLKSGQFILDIDLDFLAVQLPSWPLYLALGNSSSKFESAMHWTEQLAGLLLCPTGDQDEAAGNAAFVAMLNGLAANCGEPCDIDGWTDEQLNSFVLAPAAAVGPGTRRLLCPREPDDRASFFSSLRFRLRPLAHLGAAALAALRRLGLCFAGSPWNRQIVARSPMPFAAPPSRPQFRLCVGANLPFESAVVESPGPAGTGVAKGLRQLGDFLGSLGAAGLRPRLVTVARSGRDGYAPRALLGNLTDSVVGLLRSAFSLPAESVVMDAFLYRP
ncbi:hypothetical protein BOX15_Mlig014949g1, partial [Macrostomum lignano]